MERFSLHENGPLSVLLQTRSCMYVVSIQYRPHKYIHRSVLLLGQADVRTPIISFLLLQSSQTAALFAAIGDHPVFVHQIVDASILG
jgi:hypothetical protein